MPEPFDPYHKWLGIPPKDQPPTYYRLLGIELFEADPDVISFAADQRMTMIRSFQSGKHSAESQQILNELSMARVCLLNPDAKAEYDFGLRGRLAPPVGPPPGLPPVPPPPVPMGFAVPDAVPGAFYPLPMSPLPAAPMPPMPPPAPLLVGTAMPSIPPPPPPPPPPVFKPPFDERPPDAVEFPTAEVPPPVAEASFLPPTPAPTSRRRARRREDITGWMVGILVVAGLLLIAILILAALR
jgi:hypothetical protein